MLSVKLEGISKSFGSQKVFKGLGLEVKTGQCCGVVGPNGSGKSTLLKIIAQLISPTQGRLKFSEGQKEIPAEAAKFRTFWLAPDLEFYGELTAYENLSFFVRLRGINAGRAEIDNCINSIGLPNKSNHQVGTFSTGMKQRLKFALAMLCQPQILLLDEPGSNLDQQGVELVDGFIGNQKPSAVMFLATNNPQETRYADFSLSLQQ
jgi:heme exporter protein A